MNNYVIIKDVRKYYMSFICALEILISALTFTLTKKFSNGFEIKLQLKGADMIMCIAVILMGVLGMVPTGAAGCRSAEYLRNERNIKHVKYKGGQPMRFDSSDTHHCVVCTGNAKFL